jgi:DNA-binding response OmpR family regulator
MHDYTILLVDDLQESLISVERILRKSHYKVLAACSGKEALDIVKQQRVDLILLDVMMPGINGYETCKKLKQNSETASIPVIFVTAVSTHVDEAFAAGGVDYVTKPFMHNELKARIKTHLQLAELQQAQMQLISELSAKNAELTRQQYRVSGIADMLQNYQQIPLQEMQHTLFQILKTSSLPHTEVSHLAQRIGETCQQLEDFGNALMQLTTDKRRNKNVNAS